MSGRGRYVSCALYAVLAVIIYAVYFFRADHFFQGDTVFWFYHRLRSFREFAYSFTAPDPGGWYRPLTNRTVQSVLYPVFGFRPAGYRAAVYLFFLANTVTVWFLAKRFTGKHIAAAIATGFFAFHTVNAYTTYDLSFVPELLYTFFYICATLTFLRYQDSGGRPLQTAAVGLFILSLCSKEAAVTLPATLLIVSLIAGHKLRNVVRELIPFGIVWTVYLWFTLVHLGVASEALASLRTPPPQLETGGYYFMAGPHILGNGATAWAWALNLPVGLLGQWRDATRMRSVVLWSFAAMQMVLLVYGLVRRNRGVMAGLAWFWITALPALPLLGHFLPYYMFLPIAGFALMVGASWNQMYEDLPKPTRATAAGILGAVFGILFVVCAKSARSEARNNFLLGASSRIVETSVEDFRSFYQQIPQSAIVFIDNDGNPDLPFHQAGGGLFNVAFGDESLQFHYSSFKQSASGAAIRLVFRDGHLQQDSR